jgi:hypothetical protein
MLLVAGIFTAPSCGGVVNKQPLTERYALWAFDALAGNSLVAESAARNSCRILIEPTVFSVGYDGHFIIAARHPLNGPLKFDRSRTDFFVVTIADEKVHGPANLESFQALRTQLGVPDTLQFTVKIDQLARGQSANNPIQLSVCVVTPRAAARVAPTQAATDRVR